MPVGTIPKTKNRQTTQSTLTICPVCYLNAYTLWPQITMRIAAHSEILNALMHILRIWRKMYKNNEQKKRQEKKSFTFSMFSSYACISTGDDGMVIHATEILYFNLFVFLFWTPLVFFAISSIRTPHSTLYCLGLPTFLDSFSKK